MRDGACRPIDAGDQEQRDADGRQPHRRLRLFLGFVRVVLHGWARIQYEDEAGVKSGRRLSCTT